MALPSVVLRALVDGLGDLYDAGGAGYPARAISVVTGLIGADSCSFNFFAGDRVTYHVEPADVGAFPDSDRMFRLHLPEHPVLSHTRASGDGRARRISDFLGDRQFRALGLYRDFYRHAGVRYQAAITVPAGPGVHISIAMNRQAHDFGDDDLELLDLLRPHIGRAAASATLLAGPLPGERQWRGPEPLLTPRQRRVLQLVAEGHPDRRIGRDLGISTRTVHAHLRNIYRALDVTSRTEALARFRALALAGPPAALRPADQARRDPG